MKVHKSLLSAFWWTLLFISHYSFAQSGAGLADWQKAEALKGAKKYAEAIAQYDKAIAKEPNSSAYVFSKAQCYQEMKEAENAIKTYEQVVSLKPDHVKAYEILGKLNEENKQFDKAVACYDSAFRYEKEKNKRIDYKLNAIGVLNKARKYDALRTHIDEAKQLDPNNAKLTTLEARNYNVLGSYDEVVKLVNEFLAKNKSMPRNDLAPFYYELGFAYYKLEQYDKANSALANANFGPFMPRVFELSAKYHNDLAMAYFKVYEFEKCEEYMRQALKIDPKFQGAIDLQRDLNRMREDKSAKIKKEEDSIKVEKNPNKRSEEYCRLCVLQFEGQIYDGAASSAEECIRTQPKNLLIRFYKAMALYKMGTVDEAIGELDAISTFPKLDPDMANRIHFAMAMMFKQRNDSKLAMTYFKKAARGVFENAAKSEVKAMRAAAGMTDTPAEEGTPTDATGGGGQ